MARPNLVLVGFMGTGKSTLGPRLAERFGLDYVDLDDVIVEETGREIAAIFAEDGEAAFRAIERDVVSRWSAPRGTVVAAGGGVVLDPENVSRLRSGGLLVCLWADPDEVWRRAGRDPRRPLLDRSDARCFMERLLAAREPLYRAIRPFVDTTGRQVDDVVGEIAEIYRDRPGTATAP